jgi:translation initiation factor 1
VGDDTPYHNRFGVLGSLRGSLPERPASEPAPAPPSPSKGARPIPRAVVRMERAGRSGKDVTVVEHLDISAAERTVWLKALKAQLGCGGVIEGESLVLQGDHRKRLPALLRTRGVKKITIG